MRTGKEQGLLRGTAASIPTALLLVLALFITGTFAGNFLLRMQKDYRIELFNRAAEQQGVFVRMISDEETHRVTSKYLAALADAVVRFEFFPRQDDADIFFNMISVLPADVTVDRFEFNGRNLSVYCAAPAHGPLADFSRALAGLGCFKDASLESYQKKDGSYMGVITCIAA